MSPRTRGESDTDRYTNPNIRGSKARRRKAAQPTLRAPSSSPQTHNSNSRASIRSRPRSAPAADTRAMAAAPDRHRAPAGRRLRPPDPDRKPGHTAPDRRRIHRSPAEAGPGSAAPAPARVAVASCRREPPHSPAPYSRPPDPMRPSARNPQSAHSNCSCSQ